MLSSFCKIKDNRGQTDEKLHFPYYEERIEGRAYLLVDIKGSYDIRYFKESYFRRQILRLVAAFADGGESRRHVRVRNRTGSARKQQA